MAQYNLGENRIAASPRRNHALALTLLLDIPDLPRFDAATSTTWTLLDGAANLLRSGEGTLASAPRAERIVALAPVARLLWIETALPPVNAAKRDALLRYAIEDKLTIDPSTVHVVIVGIADGPSAEATRYVVAAIDRAWLVDALKWLRDAGLPADSLMSSATGIAVEKNQWTVTIDFQRARGFAKRADGFVYNLDIGNANEPPFGLVLALKEASEQQRAPTALTLTTLTSMTPSAPFDDGVRARWETVLGLPVTMAPAAANLAQARLQASKSANFLTAEFAPRDAFGKWLMIARPALIAVSLIAVTHIAFTLIDGWRLDRERHAIEAQMTQVFKLAFPNAQAIVDAPLQMRRNLDEMKRARGIAADTGPEALIARLTKLMQSLPGTPATVNSLTLQSGVATLDATLAGNEQRQSLQRALENMPGASIAAGESRAGSLTVRIVLRAGA